MASLGSWRLLENVSRDTSPAKPWRLLNTGYGTSEDATPHNTVSRQNDVRMFAMKPSTTVLFDIPTLETDPV